MTTPEKTSRRQRIAVILQGITAIVAVGALIVALAVNHADNVRQQQERYQSRYSQCYLLRGILLTAGGKQERTKAIAFINRTELRDCRLYAASK